MSIHYKITEIPRTKHFCMVLFGYIRLKTIRHSIIFIKNLSYPSLINFYIFQNKVGSFFVHNAQNRLYIDLDSWSTSNCFTVLQLSLKETILSQLGQQYSQVWMLWTHLLIQTYWKFPKPKKSSTLQPQKVKESWVFVHNQLIMKQELVSHYHKL